MLINCIAYQDGRKIADIPVDEISAHLSQPDRFVWVALKDATPEELEHMRRQFNLHELAIEDARHGHQRPKVEEYGDVVFAVIHLIEMEDSGPNAGELNVGEVNVFAGPNFILSVRNRSQKNFIGVRDRCEREPHLLRHGSGFVLYALIDAVVDRYFPIADAIETQLEEIEEKIFVRGSERENSEALYDLKRKVMVLKHAVHPLLEATGKLYGGRVPAVCALTQEYFRDVYDHLHRINSTIDGIRETISLAVQVNLANIAIDENETTKKLAAWAGIFAVPTAIAGIWGMNFENMPELEWPFGYPLALAIIAAGCLLLYHRFKKAGWL